MLSGRGTVKSSKAKKTLTHHLYMCMQDFGQCVGEEVGVYWAIYDGQACKPITDRYLITICKQGFLNYVGKLHYNCTVFTVC